MIDGSPGTLVHYQDFPSNLIATRPVNVWLPEDYRADAADRCPVVYMHDGLRDRRIPGCYGGGACMSSNWTIWEVIFVEWLDAHFRAAGSHRIDFDHGTETLDSRYGPCQLKLDEVMRNKGYRAGEDWTRRFEGADHTPSVAGATAHSIAVPACRAALTGIVVAPVVMSMDVETLRRYPEANNGMPEFEIRRPEEVEAAVRIFCRDGLVVVRDLLTTGSTQVFCDAGASVKLKRSTNAPSPRSASMPRT